MFKIRWRKQQQQQKQNNTNSENSGLFPSLLLFVSLPTYLLTHVPTYLVTYLLDIALYLE